MEVTNLLTFTERKQLREWFEKYHLSEKSSFLSSRIVVQQLSINSFALPMASVGFFFCISIINVI